MTDAEKIVLEDYRNLFRSDVGVNVMADTMQELGLLDVITDEGRQIHLHNYAINMIEKMGVRSPGDKLRLLHHIARFLRDYIPKE